MIAQMTYHNLSTAYRATANRFGLKAKQRDMVDASPDYLAIMFYAHHERWNIVEMFLRDSKII